MINRQRRAQVLIAVLLIALLRTLAEFFRLSHVRGPALTLHEVAPYIAGGIMAGAGALAGVIAYFAGRYGLSALLVVVTILGMLVYKIVAIGVH